MSDQRPRKQKKIQSKPISKKRKFVKDGVFYAELNDFLARELAEDGYAGCEVRVTPTRTEVIIRATRPRQVVGDQGRRVREITALVQKRFKYQKGQIILFAEKIRNKGLSALAQAQAVKFRLLQGLSVRRAAYSVVKFIMDKGAKGCEVVVSGKLRGQRAKAMKFRDGYMIHAGDATNYYVEKAVKHVHLRQGVIGIKVKIMLPHDPTGENGVSRDLPDAIKVHDPDKDEQNINAMGGIGGIGGGMGGGANDFNLYSSNQPQIDIRTLEQSQNNPPPQQPQIPPQQPQSDDQQQQINDGQQQQQQQQPQQQNIDQYQVNDDNNNIQQQQPQINDNNMQQQQFNDNNNNNFQPQYQPQQQTQQQPQSGGYQQNNNNNNNNYGGGGTGGGGGGYQQY